MFGSEGCPNLGLEGALLVKPGYSSTSKAPREKRVDYTRCHLPSETPSDSKLPALARSRTEDIKPQKLGAIVTHAT